MILQKARDALARNRWLRWQAYITAVLVINAIRLIVMWPAPASWWSVLPAPVLFVAFMGCMGMALRLSDVQARQRALERASATELRTPRAPDAGPDQCPVCGGYGLGKLAEDDRLMDRRGWEQVVPWGRRRAHWACAEFVPYEAPKQSALLSFEVDGHRTYARQDAGSPLSAYSRCKFCDDYQWASSVGAAKDKLIAHSKECPKRPQPTAQTIKAALETAEARIRLQEAKIDRMLREFR